MSNRKQGWELFYVVSFSNGQQFSNSFPCENCHNTLHSPQFQMLELPLLQEVKLSLRVNTNFVSYETLTCAQHMKAIERASKKMEDTITSTDRCGPRLCQMLHKRRGNTGVQRRGPQRRGPIHTETP